MSRIKITIDGELALTVEQAAERYGVSANAVRIALGRAGLTDSPDDKLDQRKPLYLAARLDQLMTKRPGKGSPGVPKPHKAGVPAVPRKPRQQKITQAT